MRVGMKNKERPVLMEMISHPGKIIDRPEEGGDSSHKTCQVSGHRLLEGARI
jgi:hypothetical protein